VFTAKSNFLGGYELAAIEGKSQPLGAAATVQSPILADIPLEDRKRYQRVSGITLGAGGPLASPGRGVIWAEESKGPDGKTTRRVRHAVFVPEADSKGGFHWRDATYDEIATMNGMLQANADQLAVLSRRELVESVVSFPLLATSLRLAAWGEGVEASGLAEAGVVGEDKLAPPASVGGSDRMPVDGFDQEASGNPSGPVPLGEGAGKTVEAAGISEPTTPSGRVISFSDLQRLRDAKRPRPLASSGGMGKSPVPGFELSRAGAAIRVVGKRLNFARSNMELQRGGITLIDSEGSPIGELDDSGLIELCDLSKELDLQLTVTAQTTAKGPIIRIYPPLRDPDKPGESAIGKTEILRRDENGKVAYAGYTDLTTTPPGPTQD
jgi:hypothetical protein